MVNLACFAHLFDPFEKRRVLITFLRRPTSHYAKSDKKHLEDILEELEDEKQKWDLFSDWLLRCLEGEKKTKQYPYQIFNELNFAINFEKLKCFSNESKAEIIKRIGKNFTRNRTFTFTYTKKQRFNRHLLGQYEFQKLRGNQ